MEPLFLSVREAARLCGISRSYAYELVHGRQWPASLQGRRLLIDAEALQLWAERKKACGLRPRRMRLVGRSAE